MACTGLGLGLNQVYAGFCLPLIWTFKKNVLLDFKTNGVV